MRTMKGGPIRECRWESDPAQVAPAWSLAKEDVNCTAPLEQQLAEARFLAAFCCAVYAQRDPNTVCATAAQWLYVYFGYRLAHFHFANAELESVSFIPCTKANERQELSHIPPVMPPTLKKRRLSLAGTAKEPGWDITVRFATGAGQLRILKKEQGTREASEDFLQSISGCLSSALGTALEHSRLQKLSLRDGLTGLLNRRAFEELLDIEAERRELPPLSLVMIDIDDFKSINDRFGHPAGDQVLTEVGRAILGSLRGADLAARYGGEEFAVFLPGTTAKDAFSVAERIRSRIASLSFDFSGHRSKVTASLGVANRHGKDNCGVRCLLKLADEALFQAKRSGKNRVSIHAVSPAVTSLRRLHGAQNAFL